MNIITTTSGSTNWTGDYWPTPSWIPYTIPTNTAGCSWGVVYTPVDPPMPVAFEGGYKIELDVPGVAEQHVLVQLEGDTLTIKTVRHGNVTSKEYKVPSAVMADKISASLALGVLTVIMPTREPVKREIPLGPPATEKKLKSK